MNEVSLSLTVSLCTAAVLFSLLKVNLGSNADRRWCIDCVFPFFKKIISGFQVTIDNTVKDFQSKSSKISNQIYVVYSF